MNQEEKTAERYLRSLSIGEPTFEPEGYKKPPDFSLPTNFGIEVRRLNQNYFTKGGAHGLEELSIPLHQVLIRVLESFDTRFEGRSYWVGITYNRPVKDTGGKTARDMASALDNFLQGSNRGPCHIAVNENIQLEILPSETTVPNRVFRHAISFDDDAGGSVVAMYIDNIVHCVHDKNAKIAPVRNKYQEWWLILVDTMMAWNLELHEVEQIRRGIASTGSFNKVIVIDYSGDSCLMQVGG